ncbi:hypothetical protein [Maioricimonas rarisocia]|uniref:hypothetical protein n=1 Tax=Maioricimonas rarisocia TaxID=2528026 RepID=UPI0018D215D3|nr:hypothetical protein [Maioricimonas rarisocia]
MPRTARRILLSAGILAVVAGIGAIVFSHNAASRVAAQHSVIRGQLKTLSVAVANYHDVHGRSVFCDARENSQSWRILLSQMFARDSVSPVSPHSPTPRWYRDVGASRATQLTHFRAVDVSEGNESGDDCRGSSYLIVYSPTPIQWTAHEFMPIGHLAELVRDASRDSPVFAVNAAGLVCELSNGAVFVRSAPLEVLDRLGEEPPATIGAMDQ